MELKTEKRIPCLDLKIQHQSIKKEIFDAFDEVYENTAFSGGKFVETFEADFAKFCDVKHAIGVNNGTNALHLAMRVFDIGQGDEVILPANTFIATAWAVSYVGAIPVFVDCLPDTWEIDPACVEKAINSKTKAVVGVHLYGQPCDMDELREITNRHNLYMIEDAAQAQGATFKDQTVGGLGDIACFSFYPGKNLGACGEGGAVTTNSDEVNRQLRMLRNHGCEKRYYHDQLGYNMRMGGLEAASLKVKLRHLHAWNDQRRAIAERYQKEISNPKITLQRQSHFSSSVYHLFVVTVSDREEFMDYLKVNGIDAALHYPVPCHLQKAYQYLGHSKGDFPNAENLSAHCISLPMYAELTDEQINHVIDVLNDYN